MKLLDQSAKESTILILLCSLMGLLFSILFYNHFLGVNYLFFVTAILICFLWLRTTCQMSISLKVLLHMLCIFILSSSYLIHENMLIKFANFIIIPILIMILSLDSIVNKEQFYYLLYQFFGSIGKIHLFGITLFKIKRINKNDHKKKGIIIGLLISIPLLVLIIPLMGSADIVFSYFIKNILIQFDNIQVPDYLFQLFLSIIVASFFYGYVIQLSVTNKKDIEMQEKKIKPSTGMMLPYITNITILVVMCLIYFIFSFIQFNYLFLGNVNSLDHFSYAEYARSGFFQMLLLTIINFTIIMFSQNNLSSLEGKIKLFSRSCMSALILFNYILIASSFYRMHLYESTFGYTMLRLIVYLTLILEFIIMFIVLAGVWKKDIPIFRLILIISITFYTIMNLVSLDTFIAKKNIDRYFEIGIIDVNYLHQLSYEAYPQLERLLQSDNTYIKQSILKKFKDSNIDQNYDWQEYNFSREKAMKMIRNYR